MIKKRRRGNSPSFFRFVSTHVLPHFVFSEGADVFPARDSLPQAGSVAAGAECFSLLKAGDAKSKIPR
jgi:hypothetical protein